MKRASALGIALLGVLGGLPAAAQQAGKTHRVAVLSSSPPQQEDQYLEAFRGALSGLGYREGKNLEIMDRITGGNDNLLPTLAAESVRLKPDVIVARGTAAIAAAKRATTAIPIVMTNDSDPVGSGFIVSLARPGGNITGVTNMQVELQSKKLQLLRELVPHLRRVVVIRNPQNPGNLAQWREAEQVARSIGIQAFAVDIRSVDQIDAALEGMLHLHADAVVVLGDSVTSFNSTRIVRFVNAQRLPAIYDSVAVFGKAGGLIVYAASDLALWRQSAAYVDRILKGANPAVLPVERPTTFELLVNLKTARDLGITVPQSILLRANRVIK